MTPHTDPAIAPPQSLRAIGVLLDQQADHLCSVAIVPDGIVVVVAPAPGAAPAPATAIMLTPADLQDVQVDNRARRGTLRWSPPTDPLVPTGYEDLLRALGTLAARYGWTWLRLVRGPTSLLLHHGTYHTRQSTALTAEDIAQILELTYTQRGAIRWALAHPRPAPPHE